VIQAERRVKILEIADSKGVVSVKELSRLLKTSLMTIRRDLSSLEENGQIKRTHGGVVSLKYERDIPFVARTLKKDKEKTEIGKMAAKMVENGDIIFLGSGSTVAKMAPFLKGKVGLKIVTPSLQIINDLNNEEGITLILLGGIVKGDLFATVGSIAENELKEYHFQKAFIGTSGITLEKGIFNSDFLVSSIEKLVLEKTNKIFVLADNSKFGKSALINISAFDTIYAIITDRSISDEYSEFFKRRGVSLIKA
jgi:DeoR/GlpR family transcriptional regulator of sugar metabolism